MKTNTLLRPLAASFAFFTIALGFVYPLFLTGFSALVFPDQARGSLIVDSGGKIRGSRLLGQDFGEAGHFRGRPSMAADVPCNPSGGAAGNLGPASAGLAALARSREADWSRRFGVPAPEDMLAASGSGLDPDISLEAALGQVDSVAAARGMDDTGKEALRAWIRARAASSSLPGGSRVNAVLLNKALDLGEIAGTAEREPDQGQERKPK